MSTSPSPVTAPRTKPLRNNSWSAGQRATTPAGNQFVVQGSTTSHKPSTMQNKTYVPKKTRCSHTGASAYS
jgi:hypothetical protein